MSEHFFSFERLALLFACTHCILQSVRLKVSSIIKWGSSRYPMQRYPCCAALSCVVFAAGITVERIINFPIKYSLLRLLAYYIAASKKEMPWACLVHPAHAVFTCIIRNDASRYCHQGMERSCRVRASNTGLAKKSATEQQMCAMRDT